MRICVLYILLFFSGMFPFMMLATLPLFCHADWPRALIQKLPRVLSPILPSDMDLQPSNHCIYDKKMIKSEEKQVSSSGVTVFVFAEKIFV